MLCVPSTGSGSWGGFHPREIPHILVPGVRGAASPEVLCPCGIPLGHWDVCSWPQLCQALNAGSGEAVMDQGILSLPGHSISVPCFLHGKIKTSLLTLSTGSRLLGECWKSLGEAERGNVLPPSFLQAGKHSQSPHLHPSQHNVPLSPYLWVPLPSGAGISPGLVHSLWFGCSTPSLPRVSPKLSSPRHILESGIPRGKFLHLLHNGELKSSISVNSVMVGWG